MIAYRKTPRVAWVWAASIIAMWLVVALHLSQPVWRMQHSRDLVAFGAARGFDFTIADSWRLLASQWLHVSFPHMLFNAAMIGLVGQAVERRHGWLVMVLVGIAGGALAQLSTILMQPDGYVSGASQAYLALCGLALPTIRARSVKWWTALLGVSAAILLDIVVSSHGAPKVGHLVGFALGSATALLIRMATRRANPGPEPCGSEGAMTDRAATKKD